VSTALMQERTKWIAKALRQIGKIKPGMRRKDLLKTFTTEGGISIRTQQTYVYVECPYIKVDVHFKAVDGGDDAGTYEHRTTSSSPFHSRISLGAWWIKTSSWQRLRMGQRLISRNRKLEVLVRHMSG
jgi:hypothetical protein